VSQPAPLTGTATGATTSTWSLVSGLGTATFAASNNPATSVTFNQPGSYLLRITASNSSGETSRTLPVEVITRQQNWRFTHFANTQGTGTAADTFDANGDGETNLMEFATAQNPHAATLATPTLVKSGSTLEFTYTRSNAAIADGILFAVEWDDTLAAIVWSDVGVTEQLLSNNGTLQTVRASLSAGAATRRFVRLRVTEPPAP
jgi:hypothetical protein